MFSFDAISYFGTILGRLTATLGMILAASHTAVWLGASTPDARAWVQAGLEGSHPYAYIELGRHGHQVSFRQWVVPSSHLAHVRLRHHGHLWQVTINGHRSRWWWLRRADAITTLETDSPAVAYIDGHIVKGG
jgi:hypothetical protein